MTQQPASTDFTFVDNPKSLAAAIEAIRQSPIVGFDTEFVGEATYEPQLCLLQVATDGGIFVIDPLARIDLREFWSALTAPGLELIAFAAREELLFCLRYAGRLPGVVFDPQLAAGLVGFSYPLSHTNVVQQLLGLRVGGGETRTDWRLRPLTPKQLEYAAEDVRHLATMRTALLSRAEDMGRLEWVTGECRQLVERVVQSRQRERWSRIPGASRLNRRDLAVLREVWTWRDDTARTADLTPRRVLGDDLLIEITRRSPRNATDLFALRGMDRQPLRQAGTKILAAVQAGLNLPEDELPMLLGRDDPPQVSILGQLAAILTNSLAAQHHVDNALLATTGDLQEFIRWRLGLSDEAPAQLMEGWRGQILGQPLLELLEGRMSVRVADFRSPSPLLIEPL